MAIGRYAGKFCWATWERWNLNGPPFYTRKDNCIDSLSVSVNAIQDAQVNGINAKKNKLINFRWNGNCARYNQQNLIRSPAERWSGECVEHIFQGQRILAANWQGCASPVSGHIVFPAGNRIPMRWYRVQQWCPTIAHTRHPIHTEFGQRWTERTRIDKGNVLLPAIIISQDG